MKSTRVVFNMPQKLFERLVEYSRSIDTQPGTIICQVMAKALSNDRMSLAGSTLSGTSYAERLFTLFRSRPVLTSLEICEELSTVCAGTCVADLRKYFKSIQSQDRVECVFLHSTPNGKRIYQYTYVPS